MAYSLIALSNATVNDKRKVRHRHNVDDAPPHAASSSRWPPCLSSASASESGTPGAGAPTCHGGPAARPAPIRQP